MRIETVRSCDTGSANMTITATVIEYSARFTLKIYTQASRPSTSPITRSYPLRLTARWPDDMTDRVRCGGQRVVADGGPLDTLNATRRIMVTCRPIRVGKLPCPA
jgi:hypothetical protein